MAENELLYTRAALATFFEKSPQAVDGWVRRGCPVERRDDGRIKGFQIGEVLEWRIGSTDRDAAYDALFRLQNYIIENLARELAKATAAT